MVLILDNYDSFTYNLAQHLRELTDVCVFRNDAIELDEIAALAPEHIVISPGPGSPEVAGVSVALIRRFAGKIPILGVCLGHQVVASVFGGVVGPAIRIVHGKTSPVHHDGRNLFAGLPNPFDAMRYHSFVVERVGLPECLEISAVAGDGTIMGLRHRHWPVEGVQFHPESVLTPNGPNLLRNFLLAGRRST